METYFNPDYTGIINSYGETYTGEYYLENGRWYYCVIDQDGNEYETMEEPK